MATEKDDNELVEVIATERGHDGEKVREEGEVFLVPKSRLKDGSTWFRLPKDVEAKPPADPGKKPRPPGAGPLPVSN